MGTSCVQHLWLLEKPAPKPLWDKHTCWGGCSSWETDMHSGKIAIVMHRWQEWNHCGNHCARSSSDSSKSCHMTQQFLNVYPRERKTDVHIIACIQILASAVWMTAITGNHPMSLNTGQRVQFGQWNSGLGLSMSATLLECRHTRSGSDSAVTPYSKGQQQSNCMFGNWQKFNVPLTIGWSFCEDNH